MLKIKYDICDKSHLITTYNYAQDVRMVGFCAIQIGGTFYDFCKDCQASYNKSLLNISENILAILKKERRNAQSLPNY